MKAVFLLHFVLAPLLGVPPQIRDPSSFLNEAIAQFQDNFLQWPDKSALLSHHWTCLRSENHLDSARRIKKSKVQSQSQLVMKPQGKAVDVRIYYNGQVFRRDGRLSDFFKLQIPTTESAGLADQEFARAVRSELLAITTFRFLEREILNGRESLVFEFATNGSKKKGPHLQKQLFKTKGRLWFDLEDRKLVKAEGEYLKTTLIPRGTGSVIRKGSYWGWELCRLDDGKWAPAYQEIAFKRGFPHHGFIQTIDRYQDYAALP